MEPSRILVIEDDPDTSEVLRFYFVQKGHEVRVAASGRQGLAACRERLPDIILLDVRLPDLSGLEVCQELRKTARTQHIPVIFVSEVSDHTSRLQALELGADDYVTKPFGAGELLARLRATLRRAATPTGEPVQTIGELTVDLSRRIVSVAGNEIPLTPTEYDLLRVLVSHAGKVLTHRQLLREVWGPGYESELHLLRVNISNLRRKIEPDLARPRYLVTEPGVGYRLRTDS